MTTTTEPTTPTVLYINPATGEVYEDPAAIEAAEAEGIRLEAIHLEMPRPWYETISGDDLLDYYSRRMVQLDAQVAGIDAEADAIVEAAEGQRQARKRQVEATRRTIQWLVGKRVEAEVDRRLAATNARRKNPVKSIKTAWATLGRRFREWLEVTDEAKAIEALVGTRAVRIKKEIDKNAVKEFLRAGGETIPGVEMRSEDRFYCAAAKAAGKGGSKR